MLLYNNITAIYIEKLATSMVFNQTEMIYIYIYIYVRLFSFLLFVGNNFDDAKYSCMINIVDLINVLIDRVESGFGTTGFEGAFAH
jgi:hypothetical protein